MLLNQLGLIIGEKMSISEIKQINISELKPYENNARMHGEEQLGQIERSIKEFGFTIPILIDDENTILAGHGRWNVAKKMSLEQVPCMVISHLNDTQKRAYVIADNKIAENSEWNFDIYMSELKKLDDLDFDLSTIGLDIDINLGNFSPNLDNNIFGAEIGSNDFIKAQGHIDGQIENISASKHAEGLDTICPKCHHEFKITGI